MADLARPSFWKVPREFREASPLPGQEAHLYYPESNEPISSSHLTTASHWGSTPLEKAVCSLSSANESGLKSGDVLESINDQSIAGRSLQAVTDQIQRDSSNQINLGIVRGTSPNLQTYRTLSPARVASPIRGITPVPANLVPVEGTMYQPFGPSYCQGGARARFHPLDPHSAIDQETALFEEQRREEQQAIKTTPYRSQAVVSPKPKVRHDHPTGCYLQMQGYKDAPTHYLHNNSNSSSPVPQARLNDMIHQIGVRDPNVQVKLPYNTPIGLYSQQNAMSELQRNSAPHLVSQPMQPTMHQPIQQPRMPAQQPVWLNPDSLIDGSDVARNLAASPTLRMVHEMESGAPPAQVRNQRGVSPFRARSPIPHYIAEEAGFIERSSPQQSATFKILETSLLTHPGC